MTETQAATNMFKELRVNGAIITLRKGRKAHKCSECGLLIEPGTQYYEITIGGGGLGSLKFPSRVHIECLKINEGGVNGSRKSSS